MRRRLIAAISLALLVGLAWAAAPALSLRPYMPGGVDFERPLPEPKRLGAGAIAAAREAEPGAPPPRWISPPVEAPHEFDLVGVARQRRTVEIRVREDGGEWSDWVAQEEGTPVYVDGADEAQVRARFTPRGRLHFVNVSGTAGGIGSRLLNSAREAINSAFISIATVPVAEALAPKPPVVSRAGWGADLPDGGCPPRRSAAYGSVDAAVIHHTVNANDYAPEEAAAIVLGICRFHVFGNGWDDIGYNALVDRYGTLYEGRAGGLKRPVVGAHTAGFNSETTSIASLGDHTSELPTPQSQRSIIRYLAWKMGVNRAYPVTAAVELTSGGGTGNRFPAGTVATVPRIAGHTTLNATECPGATMVPLIAGIQHAVQKRIKRYAKHSRKKCRKLRGEAKRRCIKEARARKGNRASR